MLSSLRKQSIHKSTSCIPSCKKNLPHSFLVWPLNRPKISKNFLSKPYSEMLLSYLNRYLSRSLTKCHRQDSSTKWFSKILICSGRCSQRPSWGLKDSSKDRFRREVPHQGFQATQIWFKHLIYSQTLDHRITLSNWGSKNRLRKRKMKNRLRSWCRRLS